MRYLWNVSINTLLAESTSDSTVLDNLSINGLLAQYVQKRADYRLVIQPVCSLRLHTTFFCGSINIQNKYQTKNKHGQQSVSAIRAQFFMRIRYRIHTVYRISFLPISTQK